ncbi:glutathione transferase [Actinomyces vulturis]|uniref:glutathione transferase n=1 Tax=Actinomyces vulturis TaxID=1857645 RepID=UPI000830BB52|nr:glutathione transferase [Actinomyces vulturis]
MPISSAHRFTEGDLPVEAGRYRLVVSGFCPWCRRVLIARRLLGLSEAIPVSLSYGRGNDGFWELTDEHGEPGVDPVLGCQSVADVYATTPGYTPPPTIPALVDMTTKQVVMADSGALLEDLATAWKPLHAAGAPDLYPADRQLAIKGWDEWIGEHINNAHGFITHTDDEEKAQMAADKFMISLDVIDTILARATHMEPSREAALTLTDPPILASTLATGQFLCGDEPTGPDIRLFTTMQAYVHGDRHRYPGGAPSISFWPALARWFHALESRPGWVGPEERSALGI